MTVWANWAGQQRCAPSHYERPSSEAELAEVVAGHVAAGRSIRAVGSGHSFTDIALTDSVMVDLSGLTSVTVNGSRVRAGAGITLHDLAEQLHQHGRALENQGDIDAQTLGGSLATATHGTGARFGNLSSRVTGGRLVTAAGDVAELGADPDPDVLRAARVSLGALGVLSEIELETVPAFRLHKVEAARPLREVLDSLPERIDENDHFEFYALPWSDRCLTMTSRRTDEPPRPIGRAGTLKRWMADELLANRALGTFQRIGRRFPSTVPAIGRLTGRFAGGTQRLDDSWRVFASPRRVRFTEMEYAVPRSAVRDVLERVLALIERRNLPVNFPIEVRFTAGDDALLSTAHERATAYIAVHQFVGVEYETYFRAVESITSEHGGRPHWGKRHYLTAADLAPRYPAWDRFAAVRARLDPGGTFTNAYVDRVLGPVAGATT